MGPERKMLFMEYGFALLKKELSVNSNQTDEWFVENVNNNEYGDLIKNALHVYSYNMASQLRQAVLLEYGMKLTQKLIDEKGARRVKKLYDEKKLGNMILNSIEYSSDFMERKQSNS